ncbi:MAG: glycosyl transferase, family [Deltaproteobacteria bacterium]|jgi:glycosyltransferase involved in cell wall biosynthesis|nr:glycosyl transferase, family [Deltaproteobacteria bacterium]
MKILFLSTENPYPPDGGHHLRTFNVLKILAKRHQIYFVGFAQDKREFKYIPEIKRFCETVDIYEVSKTGYNKSFMLLACKNLFSRYPLIARRYFTQEARERVEQLLDQYSIDVVHMDMLALGLYRRILKDAPVILTNHNVESLRIYRWMQIEKNLFLKSFLFYQYLKLRAFEQGICPKFDRCIVVSEYDKNYLKGLCGNDNFVVIPNGVDTRYFKPESAEVKKDHLVWVGGMTGPYNSDAVDFFIQKIWSLVKDKVPGATVDFAGGGPTQTLRNKASEDHSVQALGFVPDIRPIVQRASVFIAPIRIGSGTKIKVLNAMAQGKPVVATTTAAEGIDVAPGENILIADDPKEFAEKIVYLLSHERLAREMGTRARELMEKKYSWDVISDDIHRTYENYKK